MTIADADRVALETLDSRLKTVLPAEYQSSYDDVQPVSMGSAGLKYAADGAVAWDEMWDTFCDLAMAGGPPHKGTLLQPGSRADVEAQPDQYRDVVDEICRGVTMVTDLPARMSPVPGWIRVDSYSERMAAWLYRAIVMENVAVRVDGRNLLLPAAPHFRVEKEIKNVITVIAKTCHYWMGHMPPAQQQDIATLFTLLSLESPLIEPESSDDGAGSKTDASAAVAIAGRIHRDTGLRASGLEYPGWLGLECSSVRAAIWMMRALVVSNVLSRREGVVLFVPVSATQDPGGERVARIVGDIHRLSAALLSSPGLPGSSPPELPSST